MDETRIKQAFLKVRQDIEQLKQHIIQTHNEIKEIKRTLESQTQDQTDRQIIQTQTDKQTDNPQFKAQKSPNSAISIGNGGVQTDRQTNRQTDRQTQKFAQSPVNTELKSEETNSFARSSIESLEKVSEVLESLDYFKKEVRVKFKKLTEQEMLIFSTIYQLEDRGLTIDYSLLSEKLNLSESSIRDYVQKIIKKGVPIAKTKENNKKVTLSILPDLKKVASLSTIKQLREL